MERSDAGSWQQGPSPSDFCRAQEANCGVATAPCRPRLCPWASAQPHRLGTLALDPSFDARADLVGLHAVAVEFHLVQSAVAAIYSRNGHDFTERFPSIAQWTT